MPQLIYLQDNHIINNTHIYIIINYNYLKLQKANQNKDNIKNITYCQLDKYSLENFLNILIQLNY